MSRPLPSGSIFSIRMVFAHSTQEMSVVSGLWSSFIGGATCDITKSYIGQRLNAPYDFKSHRMAPKFPAKSRRLRSNTRECYTMTSFTGRASGRSVRIKGIEPEMTILSPS
jgi:hypothetical protein